MSGPRHIYETFIQASAEQIWLALTSAEFTSRYFHQTAVESDWQVGSPVMYRMPDGSEAVEGQVLRSEPHSLLELTWHPLYSPEMSAEPASRVCFHIEPLGAVCRLRVTHDQFQPDSQVYEQIRQGWSAILCSLKSLLETGEALPIAGNEPVGEQL